MKVYRSLRANDLKESNRISILNILKKGSCSRANLAVNLGMSKPAVSAIVDELIKEGLVQEAGHGVSGEMGGKRPILLEIRSRSFHFLAIHMNEKWYEIAVTDLAGEIVTYRREETKVDADYSLTLGALARDARELLQQTAMSHQVRSVLACSLSVRGLIDTKTGKLRYSVGLLGWRDVPLREFMEKELDMPVFIENDAKSVALLELIHDQQSHLYNFACVYVGQGLGTGVIADGEILRGANDGAVNMGHASMLEDGPLCTCGNHGCWEALASIRAFLTRLAETGGEYESMSFDQAMEKYHNGDPSIRHVLINYTAYWLGMGISNMMNIFNPQEVIVHGEINLAGEEFQSKVKEVVKQRTVLLAREGRVVFAEYDPKLQVKGAAALGIQYFFSVDDHRKVWKLPSEGSRN